MLMNIYHAAGLKDMIELFHRGVLTKCVAQAVSFDKTHTILLQCWEAFYRFEIQLFFLVVPDGCLLIEEVDSGCLLTLVSWWHLVLVL